MFVGAEVVLGAGAMADGVAHSPWSFGLGADIGWGAAEGIGGNVSSDGSGLYGVTGRGGAGAGIWAGGEACYTESHCTKEYTPD